MAIKKSELYSSLWSSADELRGGMDASQYKDYVLVMLFIKYVSDKYAGVPYADVTVPEGSSFKDMVALKGKTDIGDQINKKIIAPLANVNQLSSMPDFDDKEKLGEGKERVERLTNLISIFENPALDFSNNRAEGDDILGDAYEYLMRHFATESGKSKGQFYTPSEVSRILAQVIGIREAETTSNTTVYDPTCGSGSLLLKVSDEAKAKVTLYGQEMDSATAGLAHMNMILHDNSTALIKQGNTIANPLFKTQSGELKTFDYVVANPPFSDKRWSTGIDPYNDEYERFTHFGVPPSKQGDYAYLLHIIRSLKSTGKGACILPHGVLFRGGAEAEIRKNLIRQGYIKGIIGLPANLFYGTGIPACVIVIDKEHAGSRKGIFMADASKDFIKDGNKNRLRAQDIRKIVDVFNNRLELDKYARMVSFDEIEHKNEFNLNLPRYIDTQEAEDIQDIEAHLLGGIPESDVDALQRYWDVCPNLKDGLFEPKREGYIELAVEKEQIKTSVFEHEQFRAFTTSLQVLYSEWEERSQTYLKSMESGCHPKEPLKGLSDDLLTHYADTALIDKYDIYQHFMDYWEETMQDDCYLIAADGWQAETYRVLVTDKKGKEKDKGWACDLVPKSYIVDRYFSDEQEAIDVLNSELEINTGELSELEEEHSAEEGILKDVANKKEAQEAWYEALISLWQEEDKENYSKYTDALEKQKAEIQRLNALVEDPVLAVLANSKGTITQKVLTAQLKVAEGDASARLNSYKDASNLLKAAKEEAKELLKAREEQIATRLRDTPDEEALFELKVIKKYLDLLEVIGELKGKIKVAELELDDLAYSKYPQLSVDEIKTLVVDDKWLGAVGGAINSETERISQQLAQRIKELTERYETSLPQIDKKVVALEKSVNEHLEKMGFVW